MESASTDTYLFPRRLGSRLKYLLRHSPAVVLLGPRQVGKTTLALEIGGQQTSVYLDLEDDDDRLRLSSPARYLADHEKELVILDEVQRTPELFQPLRGIIDRGTAGEGQWPLPSAGIGRHGSAAPIRRKPRRANLLSGVGAARRFRD